MLINPIVIIDLNQAMSRIESNQFNYQFDNTNNKSPINIFRYLINFHCYYDYNEGFIMNDYN